MLLHNTSTGFCIVLRFMYLYWLKIKTLRGIKIFNSMSKTYKAIANEHITMALDASDAIATKVMANGDLVGLNNKNKVEASVLDRDFASRTYSIRLRGNIYKVTLQNKLDQQIEEMGLSLGSKATSSMIDAPMPGLVLEVLVKEGDSVEEGDGLLVLEAMKMENKLVAPRSGIIKSVHVTASQTVDKGIVLIEFEEEDEN